MTTQSFEGERWVGQNLCCVCIKVTSKNVIPAKAGIQKSLIILDSRLRGSDEFGIIRGSLNKKALFQLADIDPVSAFGTILLFYGSSSLLLSINLPINP